MSEIQLLIAGYTKLDAGPDANFGLDLISRFRTTREVYRADEKFLVMLDATDFGHWVGEVELLAHDEQRAHMDIDAFMRRYAWFFTQEKKPKSKLLRCTPVRHPPMECTFVRYTPTVVWPS